MGETNQCDGCQRGLPVDTQGTHYDPAEAGVDAWSRYRIGCTRKRYAEPDPRDAEIARLRGLLADRDAEIRADDVLLAERNRILDAEPCPTHGPCVPHVLDTLRTLRAQLAAAQADAVALRGALEMAHEVVASVSDSWPIAFERVTEAIATPATGAPLLDAVRDMCADLDMLLGVLTYNSKTDPPRAFVPKAHGATFAYYIASLSKSLAAVRAVLSRAQDTAGISRGGDSQ